MEESIFLFFFVADFHYFYVKDPRTRPVLRSPSPIIWALYSTEGCRLFPRIKITHYYSKINDGDPSITKSGQGNGGRGRQDLGRGDCTWETPWCDRPWSRFVPTLCFSLRVACGVWRGKKVCSVDDCSNTAFRMGPLRHTPQ